MRLVSVRLTSVCDSVQDLDVVRVNADAERVFAAMIPIVIGADLDARKQQRGDVCRSGPPLQFE